MPVKNFDFRGSGGGLVKDSNQFTLNDNEWSDVLNVRFRNRAVSKIEGQQTLLPIVEEPRHSIFVPGSGTGDFYYYINDQGRTYRVNANGTETEATRGTGGTIQPLAVDVDYQMSLINGGVALLVNDGENEPEYITSVGTGTNVQELTPIPGWNYDAGFTNVSAGVIRPFKYVMVAGNITQTQVSDNSIKKNRGTIRVSNQAAPGGLPTWDPAASGADTAEEFELSESGEIRELVSLGDNLMIFTEDDIYSLRITANPTVPITVAKQLSGRGILATNCAVEFFGKLFVVGNEDIYIFQGGANANSVSEGRVRDYFFDNLNQEHFSSTFVVHNERYDEIWVCYPDLDSDGPANKALIWNYSADCWSLRELPNVYTGGFGAQIITQGGGLVFDPSQFTLVLPSTDLTLTQMDVGTTFSNVPFNAYAERKGIELNTNDVGTSKWTSDVAFLITGTGSVDISMRTSDTPGTEVDLASVSDPKLISKSYQIDGGESDLSVHSRIQGKFMNVRVDGTDDWSLHNYQADFETTQRRSR